MENKLPNLLKLIKSSLIFFNSKRVKNIIISLAVHHTVEYLGPCTGVLQNSYY